MTELREVFQNCEHFFGVGLSEDLVDLGEGELAGFVHDEDGAVADSCDGRLLTQHAVSFRDVAMWEEVAGDGEADATNGFLLPCNMAGNAVGGNGDDLR